MFVANTDHGSSGEYIALKVAETGARATAHRITAGGVPNVNSPDARRRTADERLHRRLRDCGALQLIQQIKIN